MNVKLRVLSAGALFFLGQVTFAQKKPTDSTKETKIEEVVVLGYSRTATKPKSTAATTTVSAETFENRPNVTLLQSLQGAAPGLTVSTSSGSPGTAKIDLLVRGLGTLSADTQPLFVIDGVPTNSVLFRSINPEDIESASVLRDAIATSIYGNRGANGVVVITTKSGKFNSGLRINYSGSTSFSFLPKQHYNLANSQEALRIERESQYGLGYGDNPFFNYTAPLTDAQINSFGTTDYLDEFFRTGFSQNHNVNFAMGGKNISNFTSLSYTSNEGIVPTTDFQRFTFRTNFNGQSDDGKFKYGTSFTTAFSRRHQLDQETAAIDNNSVQNPLLGALTALPYYPADFFPTDGQELYNTIGSAFGYGASTAVLKNILTEGNIPNRINEIKILGNINAKYNFTDELSFSTKMGVDFNQAERTFARAPSSYLSVVVRETSALPYGGLERVTNDKDFGFNFVSNFNYSKTFGEKHVLDLGAYAEYIRSQRTVNQLQQNGLDLKTYAFGAGTGWTNVGATYPALRPTVSALKQQAGIFSYFGTLGYEYDGKYGLDAIVRRDASYRFVADYKWGTFWSVGARWNVDKEGFMNGSAFRMLKLRGSYGTQGNQNLLLPAAGGNPIYLGNNLVRDLVGTGTGYGNTGSYVLSQLANPLLHWEKQTMANIGVDFDVWNSRLTGSVDIYSKKTSDLFNDINISAIVGYGSTIKGNQGGISNKGIEAALRYKVLNRENFKLSVYANGSYNKNEITDIERTIAGDRIYENGSLVNEFYVVPYVGVNPETGNLLFLDINNNVTENVGDADRRATGKTDSAPKYQGAFGLSADYKGFYLDAQVTFVKDIWRYDYAMSWLLNPGYVGDNNVSADLLNAWTPTNTNTDVPSLFASNVQMGTDYSDRWLKDASYMRLKNVQLGYNVSRDLLRGTFIRSLKLYVQGENLHTWTKWKGFDPESTDASNLGKFPSPKTYSVGVNVEF